MLFTSDRMENRVESKPEQYPPFTNFFVESVYLCSCSYCGVIKSSYVGENVNAAFCLCELFLMEYLKQWAPMTPGRSSKLAFHRDSRNF